MGQISKISAGPFCWEDLLVHTWGHIFRFSSWLLFKANPPERGAVEHEVSLHDFFWLVLSEGKCGYP